MQNKNYRRLRARVNVLGTPQMHYRNPWIIALWSAIFPGTGHMLLSMYIPGFIFFIWEVIINLKAQLNLSIFYSFTGEFELAKTVLDTRWALAYIPTYLFAVWHSYQTAVEMNHHFLLAEREDAPVKSFIVGRLGFNYLDNSPPLSAAVWSMLSPGIGHLASRRIVIAFFLISWWIAVSFFSKILPAIHFSMLLQFELAKAVADKQWILNVPSLFFFGIYGAYTNAVENNKLYDWELGKYLRKTFQPEGFPIPAAGPHERGSFMHIVSNFNYSIQIEEALTELMAIGVAKDAILAVPLDTNQDETRLMDSMHYTDNTSTLDGPIITAATFALFGMIYGFVLAWGPIIWALIGTAAGFLIGLCVKYLLRRRKTATAKKTAQVVVLVSCDETQADTIRDILRKNGAIGVSRLSLAPRESAG